MFSGPVVRVTMRADKLANRNIVGHIVDWFDKGDLRFSDECDEKVIARVTVSEQAMVFWAMQYGTAIEVLEPASLREHIRSAVSKMAQTYEV